MYIPNNISSKYAKQNFLGLHGKIDKSKVIIGDFRTPVSIA